MDVYQEFLEKTKQLYAEENDQKKGITQPPSQLLLDSALDLLSLPSPEDIKLGDGRFADIINSRRSIRRYSETPLSLEELAYLLWNTQGVHMKGNKLLRTVPSAGGRHPFETFLVINNVAGLKPGLYRYLAIDH